MFVVGIVGVSVVEDVMFRFIPSSTLGVLCVCGGRGGGGRGGRGVICDGISWVSLSIFLHGDISRVFI